MLVRAASSSSVGKVQQAIQTALPQAQVASSKQVADQISGSLVDASNLSKNLGVVLSIVAAAAAFLLAALLALSSVGKRVRELGTLKALGWTQRLVVRQIAGESLAQGVLGGLAGSRARRARRPRDRCLRAVARRDLHDRQQQPARSRRQHRPNRDPHGVAERPASACRSCSLGFALALLGGLIAGAAGALRAARLRPADALRQVD